MYIFYVEESGKENTQGAYAEVAYAEVAIEKSAVPTLARILEQSSDVRVFYIKGLNEKNQQSLFGLSGFKKWINPISL